MQENNQLKTFVENGEKVLMGEHRGRLQSLLEQAKSAYKEAHDAGDATGMVAAQEQIASAIAKMERASAQQPMRLQKEDETIFNRPAQPQQAQPDPAALKWAEEYVVRSRRCDDRLCAWLPQATGRARRRPA
jgi:hypothetical protein